ncbi:paralemmin-1 isoform X2 [Ambystoma mexicanum]|uniref:paralemmin-1 isoform X2 n=1 Tax=Ambystoma mexicanum TaxID=8296 RepID=UPI0037E8C920
MESPEAVNQQERLQAIAEKRKRQTEIENKRRQLEDDRRQVQHLKSKALRERWLMEGTPSSASEEDEAMKKQIQEDEQKTKELEDTIQRLEKELEILENGVSATSTQENLSEEAAKGEELEEVKKVVNDVQKTPQGTPKGKPVPGSPMRMVESAGMMKAVVHEVRVDEGSLENGVHLLSSTEVEDLLHKADEVTMSEDLEKEGAGEHKTPSQKNTPRKEITGVQAKVVDSPKVLVNSEGAEPSKEQPVTMIFMGYQNVEDENETKKVLGLEGTIKAELVVIEDGESKAAAADHDGKDQDPPNGNASEAAALLQKGDNPLGTKPEANDTEPKEGEPDLPMKKHRCKCCTVM